MMDIEFLHGFQCFWNYVDCLQSIFLSLEKNKSTPRENWEREAIYFSSRFYFRSCDGQSWKLEAGRDWEGTGKGLLVV